MNDARKPRKCQVLLLDERRLDILIQPRLVSCDLLDMVASHFNLHEKEYFGLAFFDETGHQNWLRLDKRVLEHDLPRYQDPLLLVFCVRFFVPNIIILKEASTIELFYLQARTLIFKGSIHCDSETVFELAGYALQASRGDIVSDETAKADLRRMPLLPTRTLKEHPSISYCEDRVLAYYQKSAGQTRIEAILRYLGILQSLPTYGVHYYEVKDKNNIPWWLGLSPKGIGVYDHGDKIKPRKVFLWSQIENIYFRERKFSLEIRETAYRHNTITQNISGSSTLGRKSSNPSNMMVHAWYTSTSALAKTMWTMAISQHQFYLDKKHAEVKASRIKTLKEMAQDLSDSTTSIPSMSTSDSISIQSEQSHSVSSMNGGEVVSQAVEQEMVSALVARKEALLERLKEKTAELKKLCIQEAELTGEYPAETPYTPGSPLPQLRRRVGTAFDFSDFVIDDGKNEDEEIKEKSFEVEIQTKITSAAQKLAEDRSAGKSVRKTRKLTYQKSLRKLKLMKDTLEKLKEAKRDAEDGHNTRGGGKINTQFGTVQSSYSEGSLLFRTNLNDSTRSLEDRLSSQDDSSEHTFSSEPPSPMFYEGSLKKYPSSPSTRLFQGDVEAGRRYSPGMNRERRSVPAFQYSDSDRSDCSTKPSSVSSSYANSEDFGVDNGESQRFVEAERYPYGRRIGSSWDNLNTRNKSRSPSPGPSGSRSAGQSAESLCSDHDPFSPSSPGFGQNRKFSFGSSLHPGYIDYPKVRYLNTSDLENLSNSGQLGTTRDNSGQLGSTSFGNSAYPEHINRASGRYLNTNQLAGNARTMSTGSYPEYINRPKVRYLNTSDLAIMSNSGQSGSYSVTHMGSARNSGPRGQLGRGQMSTSMSTIARPLAPSYGSAALRTVKSHVDMSTAPYISNLGHRNYHSSKGSFDEEQLEWGVDTDQEATLV